MFKLGRMFHVIHIADELQALDAWYDEVFSVTRFMGPGYSAVEKRDASLVLISDFVMEPMTPAVREEGWEAMPVGRFHHRFGQHLHSIAWYVTEDSPSLFHSLRNQNYRLFGDGGVTLGAEPPRGTIFTHPRDTCCQWELMSAPSGSAGDPRFKPDWSPAFWRDEHPLGILPSSYHITVVVQDLERAKRIYTQGLNGRLIHEEVNDVNKTKSAFVFVGEDSVVELALPTSSDGLAGKDLEKNGEIVHAVTFRVKDVGAAANFVRGKNIGIENRTKDSFVMNPQDAFGAVIYFTERAIPNDPRS